MGFRPEPTIYKLNFKDSFLDGLSVRASCCTLKEYNEMMRASVESVTSTSDAEIEDATGDELDKIRDTIMSRYHDNNYILDLFATHLVSWNLEDLAGQPVPATRDGMDTQERNVISQIISAWQMSMVSVPNSSKPVSNDGKILEEQSLGLGSVSESPGN